MICVGARGAGREPHGTATLMHISNLLAISGCGLHVIDKVGWGAVYTFEQLTYQGEGHLKY